MIEKDIEEGFELADLESEGKLQCESGVKGNLGGENGDGIRWGEGQST